MKLLYVLLACGLLLQACGGGDPPANEPPLPPAACSVERQRESLRDFMQREYYWYSQLRTPDDRASSQDLYFQSMLPKPPDRYSFTQTAASFEQVYTEGKRIGYGYTVVWGDAERSSMRIRNVEPLSPAALAGIGRGDTVLAIDGFGPEEISAGRLATVSTPGVSRVFVLRSASGHVREVTVLSNEYALSPVAATARFDVTRDGTPMKVGYVAYHQFVGYSVGQLALAFTEFAHAGVSELILDLRYNGGGSIGTARDLASMVGGSRTAGQMFSYLRHNDKQVAKNIRVGFNMADTPLSLPLPQGVARVIVITSGSTASSSELLINGLRPFVEVVLVGEKTYGKPYGFTPRDQCGTIYNAVQFVALNWLGTADFAEGFTPDCPVPDDLDRALGDPQEGRLRAALDYVATGSCTQAAASSLRAAAVAPAAAPSEVFGDVLPPVMFAD